MFKKLLMSGLVLGALAATVGAGSYAAFTDTSTGTGTITAATINIDVDGEIDDTFVLTFAPTNLLPSESSSDTFSLANVGNRDVHVVATPVVTGGTALCPVGNLTPVVVSIANLSGSPHAEPPVHIADGDTEVGTVTATLDAGAPEDCQGVSFTVTVTLVATGVADGS